MPNPFDELISTTVKAPVRVRMEPVFNAIQGLLFLTKVDYASDLGEWTIQTALAMTPEERATNDLVANGFYYAITPTRSWPSFPAYLTYLKNMDPLALRNKMLDTYMQIPEYGYENCGTTQPGDIYQALGSVDSYIEYLRTVFGPEHVFPEIESRAYAYVIDPPAMKQVIVDHLSHMWEKYLSQEWKRVQPMLQEATRALENADLSKMDRFEAARWITGQDIEEEKWAHLFEISKQIIFVPSVHAGPYLTRFHSGDTLWVLFRARLPRGAEIRDTDLSRAEILVRLDALSDDNRLRILKYIASRGEIRSQELIDGLDLSQSAASRHLTTLSGLGYLSERRCDGAKCYALNSERIEETLQALSKYLLGR